MSKKLMWWGYLHINGTIHLKRYFSKLDIQDAKMSSFVKYTVQPFEADNREKALKLLINKIKIMSLLPDIIEEEDPEAILLYDNLQGFTIYYCNLEGCKVFFKIPLHKADMVYPGIPAKYLTKYITEEEF